MKSTLAIALFLGAASAFKLEWPSVARCKPGQKSYDSNPCDHNNNSEHPHDGTVLQMDAEWPSVARCKPGQKSYDSNPCDHNNNSEHPHDGTVLQVEAETAEEIVESWPSVARCKPGQKSYDSNPCDHNNNSEHPHDGTVLQMEFRPPIKCKDPLNGNPISCDYDDINEMNDQPLAKDENGFTPTKEIFGGPLVDNDEALE